MATLLESVLWERFSDMNFAKGLADSAVWKVAQISQDWIKMLPIIKYYVRRLNS